MSQPISLALCPNFPARSANSAAGIWQFKSQSALTADQNVDPRPYAPAAKLGPTSAAPPALSNSAHARTGSMPVKRARGGTQQSRNEVSQKADVATAITPSLKRMAMLDPPCTGDHHATGHPSPSRPLCPAQLNAGVMHTPAPAATMHDVHPQDRLAGPSSQANATPMQLAQDLSQMLLRAATPGQPSPAYQTLASQPQWVQRPHNGETSRVGKVDASVQAGTQARAPAGARHPNGKDDDVVIVGSG
jgi:hypothetical protein